MDEENKPAGSFVGYEYHTVTVDRKMESIYTDAMRILDGHGRKQRPPPPPAVLLISNLNGIARFAIRRS